MLEMFITAELAKVKSIVPTVKGLTATSLRLRFHCHRHWKNTSDGRNNRIPIPQKRYKALLCSAPNLTLYEKLIKDFGDELIPNMFSRA